MSNIIGDPILGKKITDYRKAKGLTLSALAGEVEISPSMLSQIEKGLANPSLNTLKLLAKVLEVSLFNLFLEDEQKENLVVKPENRKKIISAEQGNISYELLTPDLKGRIEFALMKIEPKNESSVALISHIGEETAYVIKGKVDICINSQENILTLETGDSIRLLPNTKHKWKNNYDLEVEVIFAVTPPSF